MDFHKIVIKLNRSCVQLYTPVVLGIKCALPSLVKTRIDCILDKAGLVLGNFPEGIFPTSPPAFDGFKTLTFLLDIVSCCFVDRLA